VRLNEIAAEFAGKVAIYCVYINEAHPDDGWQVEMNVDADVIHDAPTTLDERADLAEMCVLRLNLKVPMLLDDMSDTVDGLYHALPERLYLLDAGHRIVWRTVTGPRGFDPDAWANEIRKLVG
tara:strand:+ start:55 stop:423 length:369 start_codon:yes stop_codon:yes gene_type:complete